jgi:hypothetical protein
MSRKPLWSQGHFLAAFVASLVLFWMAIFLAASQP